MIRSRYVSTFVLAALMGAAPAFADSSTSTTTTPDTSKPLCSSFKNPNAGKLAGKDTGEAREHSASPVHMDCIPDSTSDSATSPSSSSSTSSSLSPSLNVNPKVGVDANVGIGSTDANQPSSGTNPTSTTTQGSSVGPSSTDKASTTR